MSIFTKPNRSKKQLRTVSDALNDNTGIEVHGESAVMGSNAPKAAPSRAGSNAPKAAPSRAGAAPSSYGTGYAASNATASNAAASNAASNGVNEASLAEQLAALLGSALLGGAAVSGNTSGAATQGASGAVSVQMPNYDSLVELFEAYLRPTYDRAIENRQAAAETSMAELDADAYSRGMGASTFVSSMHGRETDDMNDDIAMLETEYASALSERLYKAMETYSKLKLEADIHNAEAALSSGKSRSSGGRSSGGRSSSSGSGSGVGANGTGMAGEVPFSFNECRELLDMLSTSERYEFFMSGDAYWRQMRDEMVQAIGRDRYLFLKDTYFGGSHGRSLNRDVIR